MAASPVLDKETVKDIPSARSCGHGIVPFSAVWFCEPFGGLVYKAVLWGKSSSVSDMCPKDATY